QESKDQPALEVTANLGPLAPETPQQAVVKYTLASALMPFNREAYLRRGRAHYQLQHWREAADDLGVALALNPANKDLQVWFEMGFASAAAPLPKQVLAAYSQCIELNPNGDAAWNNRGGVYEQLGQLDQAVKDFSKAIELNAKAGIAWNNRSRVHASLGQWEKAVADCTRQLELE